MRKSSEIVELSPARQAAQGRRRIIASHPAKCSDFSFVTALLRGSLSPRERVRVRGIRFPCPTRSGTLSGVQALRRSARVPEDFAGPQPSGARRSADSYLDPAGILAEHWE